MSMKNNQVCTACGKEIIPGARYCGYCGKEVKQLEPAVLQRRKKRSFLYRWGVPGGIVAALIIIVLIATHFLEKSPSYGKLTKSQQEMIEDILSQEDVWKESGCTNVFFTNWEDQPAFVTVISTFSTNNSDSYTFNYYSYSGEMEIMNSETRGVTYSGHEKETRPKLDSYYGFEIGWRKNKTREYLAEKYLSYLD